MEEANKEKKTVSQVFSDAFKELGTTMKAFVKAPRALWGINIPYLLEGLVYFGLLTLLVTFLNQNVKLSDVHAGWVTGAVTGGITFAMLLLGGVSDKIGVRLSIALSLAVMAFGRFFVSLSGTIPLGSGMGSPMFFMMAFGLFFMVAAYGLYMPAAYAGVKRYTNPQTAAIGYAVIYGLMNLGAFFSGLISPNVRHAFDKLMPPNGIPMVFWIYTGFTVISSALTLIIITKAVDKKAVDRVALEAAEMSQKSSGGESAKTSEPKKEEAKICNTLLVIFALLTLLSFVLFVLIKTNKVSLPSAAGYVPLVVFLLLGIWEFLRKRPDHPFRDSKFVFFIFILIPVQTLFAHNWLTIPIYLQRAFAAESAANKYFEFFSNLNPIIIFVLAPIVAGLTARANVYRMMIVGTLVMSLPTFLLALPPNVYLFTLFIVLMSVGEAMWQPRFLQWVAEIAPEGKTGMYMGVGQFPWFLTKMITASYSGWFLARYLPDPALGQSSSPQLLWLIYAFIAVASPVALFLAKGWMYKGMTKKG